MATSELWQRVATSISSPESVLQRVQLMPRNRGVRQGFGWPWNGLTALGAAFLATLYYLRAGRWMARGGFGMER